MDARTLSDELAIRRLLAEYCQLCDDGRFPELVDRFARSGSFVFGDHVITGRDALIAWFEHTQAPARRGKHLTSNVIVELAAGGEVAMVASDFVFLGFVQGVLTPIVAGRYVDEMHRIDGIWRIDRRVVTTIAPLT